VSARGVIFGALPVPLSGNLRDTTRSVEEGEAAFRRTQRHELTLAFPSQCVWRNWRAAGPPTRNTYVGNAAGIAR
jgi:hypothetical protein